MKKRYYNGGGEWKTRKDYRKNFRGSDELFQKCWKRFLNARDIVDDIPEFLEAAATEEVNNEKSRFYIHG